MELESDTRPMKQGVPFFGVASSRFPSRTGSHGLRRPELRAEREGGISQRCGTRALGRGSPCFSRLKGWWIAPVGFSRTQSHLSDGALRRDQQGQRCLGRQRRAIGLVVSERVRITAGTDKDHVQVTAAEPERSPSVDV
jgi:hypothetical protein